MLSVSLFSKAQLKFFADTSILKLPTPKLQYTGNYNQFDIYKSSPDNMIVIKPDSSNYFTMPNAVKSFIIQTPFVKPKEK